MPDNASELMVAVEPRLLAPFEPPASLVFSDWAKLPAPRPLPSHYFEQRVRNKKVGEQICFGIALLCLIASLLPMTADAALYFLPLGYLHWVALAMALIGGLVLWTPVSTAAPCIQEAIRGEPVIVRIEKLARGPSMYMNGAPVAFHYLALISLPGPSGELEQVIVSCDAGNLQRTRCTYQVGDYAIAFRHKGRLQLYGFSGLAEGEGIVATRDETHPALVVSTALFVVCLIGVCFVLAFSTFRYFPLSVNGNLSVPLAIGVGIGLVGLALWIFRARRLAAAQEKSNEQAASEGGVLEFGAQSTLHVSGFYGRFFKSVLAFGVVLLPVAVCCLLAVRLNAALDQSVAHEELIDDVRCLMTTHNFILRDYKIEFARNGKKDSLIMTPQEMVPLLASQRAVIDVRDGAFGWPWIDRVRPRL